MMCTVMAVTHPVNRILSDPCQDIWTKVWGRNTNCASLHKVFIDCLDAPLRWSNIGELITILCRFTCSAFFSDNSEISLPKDPAGGFDNHLEPESATTCQIWVKRRILLGVFAQFLRVDLPVTEISNLV